MINPWKVAHVKRLLAEGQLTHRAISTRTGVSRGSVSAIAAGSRPNYDKLKRQSKENHSPLQKVNKYRCLKCGAVIKLVSCVACEGRTRETRGRLGDEEEDPSLDLRPEHWVGYIEIRGRQNATQT